MNLHSIWQNLVSKTFWFVLSLRLTKFIKFLKKIYLFTWWGQMERERESQEDFPLSKEPSVGLDPMTLGL